MDNNVTGAHDIKINERKHITITGIKKINRFDQEEFLMDSNLGLLVIRGSDLELVKLDTHDGVVAIKGLITGLNYVDDKIKNKEESVWSKLFK